VGGGLLNLSNQVWLSTLAVRQSSNGDTVTASPQGAGHTERWELRSGPNSDEVLGAGSTQPPELLLPAVNWSLSASRQWVLGVLTLNPTGSC
jgi:hypothetical protein